MPRNKKLILDFVQHIQLQGLTKPRVLFYLKRLNHLGSWVDKEFSKCTKKDIEHLVKKINDKGYTEQTRIYYLGTVKRFFKWLRNFEGEQGFPEEVAWIKTTLKDGRWLDLGTIERLILYPTAEERPAPQGMAKYVTGVNPWNRTVIIDAVGLERLLLAIEDKQSIFETSLLQPLVDTGQTLQDIESVRMLHRIFTDATWDGLQSRQRKAKANKIMTAIDGLPPEKIKIPLQIPAEQYEYLFPELKNGIERASRTTC